jgi:cytochrome c peroxidase
MLAIMKELKIEWPRFEAGEMNDVIAYLYFLNFIGTPGDPEKGEQVFREKGCSSCHTKTTGSKTIGPELANMEKLTSPIQMSQIMWNHAPKMEQTITEAQMQWPKFDKTEMRNLYAFFVSSKSIDD